MKLGLKSTLVVILIVAGAFPLASGLLIIEWLGHRYYQASKGQLFQTTAEEHAHALSQVVRGEINSLKAWTELAEVGRTIDTARKQAPDTNRNARTRGEELEAKWEQLAPESP